MQKLKEFKSIKKGLPDLLNWAAVIEDGIVLNKDGSLTAGYFYKGKDLSSSSTQERNQVSAFMNAALSRLGSEWVLHQDAVRVEARGYPREVENDFPDAITRLIDDERRASFSASSTHYESIYAFTLTYLPESIASSKFADLMFENEKGSKKESPANKALEAFKRGLSEFEDQSSSVLMLERMRGIPYTDESGDHINDQLLQYLHYCLTGLPHPINLPPCPMYLDAVIGSHELSTGVVPMIEDNLIQIVAIDGFPQESYPGILNALDQVPMKYRWSTRFIFQDAVDAEKGLVNFRKKWEQKVRGFWDQIFYSKQTSSGRVNQDALEMVGQAESAISDVNSGLVKYGYYTSVVVITGKNREKIQDDARKAKKLINNLGFAARIETVNTVEAFLGSLPSHVVPNLRRPMLHTLHLSDLLPLTSVWAGQEYAPCPFYPLQSPPLLFAETDGSTPFRLNLHVGDVGHTLMIGPTGSGKSTALALIAAQFRRYPEATVFSFDKGNSIETLTRAVGGDHFNVSGSSDSPLSFAPLSKISNPNELAWAEDWVCNLVELQSVALTPSMRAEIHRSLVVMAQSTQPNTMTHLQITLQDRALKEAIEEYTMSGSLGEVLDAEEDNLEFGRWACFEIEELMQRGDRVKLPVLLYLFHMIERNMKGQPCLLLLDEAWLMLSHPVFKAKITEWLKVLRKINCSVVLATQSITDAENSGILDVLVESCPTKIFLANRDAMNKDNQKLYSKMGCNETEIINITHMIPKREYFIKGEGSRVVSFAIGQIALAFVGVSAKPELKEVRELQANEGDRWAFTWLKNRGVNYEGII